MILDPAVYWRLRFLEREVNLAQSEAMRIIGVARARLEQACHEVGLDPQHVWEFEDATCSISPRLDPAQNAVTVTARGLELDARTGA